MSDVIDKLERLSVLFERGFITKEEFEEQKRRILSGTDDNDNDNPHVHQAADEEEDDDGRSAYEEAMEFIENFDYEAVAAEAALEKTIGGLTIEQLRWTAMAFWQMGVLSGLYKRASIYERADTDMDTLVDVVLEPFFREMSTDDDALIAALGKELPAHPIFMETMGAVLSRYRQFSSTTEFMATEAGKEFRAGFQATLDDVSGHSKAALKYVIAQLETRVRVLP